MPAETRTLKNYELTDETECHESGSTSLTPLQTLLGSVEALDLIEAARAELEQRKAAEDDGGESAAELDTERRRASYLL